RGGVSQGGWGGGGGGGGRGGGGPAGSAAGAEQQGNAGEGCRQGEGGAAQRASRHELDPGMEVPTNQLMDASASAVVQSGACGFCSSCNPPSLRSPRSFGSSTPFSFGA